MQSASRREGQVHQDYLGAAPEHQHCCGLRVRRHPGVLEPGPDCHQSCRQLLLPAAGVPVRQQRQAHSPRPASGAQGAAQRCHAGRTHSGGPRRLQQSSATNLSLLTVPWSCLELHMTGPGFFILGQASNIASGVSSRADYPLNKCSCSLCSGNSMRHGSEMASVA